MGNRAVLFGGTPFYKGLLSWNIRQDRHRKPLVARKAKDSKVSICENPSPFGLKWLRPLENHVVLTIAKSSPHISFQQIMAGHDALPREVSVDSPKTSRMEVEEKRRAPDLVIYME
nr:hypothetical protein Iba_chr11eCG5370 [Ipomoea batatas]